MALVPIGTAVSVAEEDLKPMQFVGSDLIIGEDIFAGAACYIASFNSRNQGIVMMSGGATYNALNLPQARVDGFCPVKLTYNAVKPPAVALVRDTEIGGYIDETQTALVPGSLYLSNTDKGRLDTAANVANARPCALVVKKQNIRAGSVQY